MTGVKLSEKAANVQIEKLKDWLFKKKGSL